MAIRLRPVPLLVALSLMALASSDAEAKKKKKAPPPPKVGWQQEEGWKNACYFPPDWGSLTEIDRRTARAKALDEMKAQWAGGRSDGVSFTEQTVEDAETTLLGRPELIEQVATENLTLCQGVATGKAGPDQWQSWLRALPGKLTAGECAVHLDYTMFDYLDIGTGWQRPLGMCQGDKVRISGTVKDKYRVRDDGPWITVAGDAATPTSGGDWPCNVGGCLEGMLVARFVTEAGVEIILPVGTELVFTAPEHGELSYRINDTTFYDNTWFKSGTITDRTAIEISPAQ